MSFLFSFLIIELGFVLVCLLEGRQDSRHTRTEAELVRCRKKSGDKDLLADDLKNKEAWHSDDVLVWGAVYLTVALSTFGVSWLAPLVFVSLAGTRGIVFNISHNLRIGEEWNHIGQGKLEKRFEGRNNLYFGIIFLIKLSAVGGLIFLGL